jgi:hypothetical protein
MTERYKLYPKKHLLPYDGMSITANVWREAHEYPVQLQNAHQALLHGVGIVQGLDVVASDPPSSVIYILPGVAVDTAGRMIVLHEALAYDLGDKIEGALHLLLLHREVKVQTKQDEEANGPAYMQDEFVIVARAEALDVPHVELARIDRKDVKSVIVDAENPHAPQVNAIDLRFRQIIHPFQPEQIRVGLCYLGEFTERVDHLGILHLAQPLTAASRFRLVLDKDVPLEEAIFNYPLIYLVVDPSAKLDKHGKEILQSFIQNGGKLLVEFASQPTEEAITALLKQVGVKSEKLDPDHELFHAPYFFMKPPPGSFMKDGISVWCGDGVVLCTDGGYGKVWSGHVPGKDFTHSSLRDALEWGVNQIVFLLSQS